MGIRAECVFTSEIKDHAVRVLRQNYPDERVPGCLCKQRNSAQDIAAPAQLPVHCQARQLASALEEEWLIALRFCSTRAILPALSFLKEEALLYGKVFMDKVADFLSGERRERAY